MNDEEPLPPPTTQRRTFILAGLGAAALALAGLEWLPRRAAIGNPPRERTVGTLLAFTAALFGRDLSADAQAAADLTDRLETFASVDSYPRDCAVLAHYLDERAAARGATRFTSCSTSQKDSIVGHLMAIDAGSLRARVLARVFPGMREHYRMRSSTVPLLAWLYRHSAAAWRARGYSRWPGIAGDWRETLSPGTPYP